MGKQMKQMQSLCYSTNLRRSANRISEYYNKQIKPAGITAAQFSLLNNLRRMNQANVTDWAQAVGLERTTMIRNIRPLESGGFIQRAEGHGKTYKLSRKGENILKKADPLWQKAQRNIEEFLGDDDAEAILRISRKLQALEI